MLCRIILGKNLYQIYFHHVTEEGKTKAERLRVQSCSCKALLSVSFRGYCVKLLCPEGRLGEELRELLTVSTSSESQNF